jgi:hypothetical protein
MLAGEQITLDNPHLATWITTQGLRGRIDLFGTRNRLATQAAQALVISTSHVETFPNVV